MMAPATPYLQPHTPAVAEDSCATGLMLSTNVFLMVAMVKLARAEAGCDGDDDCRETI